MKRKSRAAVLAREKMGVIMRVFATEEKFVARQVEETLECVKKLYDVKIDGGKFFSKILVIVWDSPSYRPASDCGLTFNALDLALKNFKPTVEVLRFSTGDLFCGILNFGMRKLYEKNVKRGFVVSAPIHSYINTPTLELFLESFCDGALVSSAAINELRKSVIEGRVANTFAAWDIGRLIDVGGFALRAAMPQPTDPCKYVLRGWDEEKKQEVITIAGVEECLPCAFLYRENVDPETKELIPCIAPIIPVHAENAKYNAPDPNVDPKGHARHTHKMRSKEDRQIELLSSHGFLPSFLKKAVMKVYKTEE